MDLNKLADVLGKVKDLKRQGWCNLEVSGSESVAAHSYGVALLAYLLCPENLNKQKCLEFAIVHDLAEIIVGDITPGENVPANVKHDMEVNAIRKIAADLNKPELAELFIEYERQDTPEADFVKRLDRLDAVALAKYYDDDNRTNFYKENNVGYDSLYDEFETNHRDMIAPIIDIMKKG
ncbi:MAG: HD domain-containing protein [Lactobacillaceae bacterium]|jgi:putative hydrolase of HD superfamily|nr:HD domain-containing protein [Lactobacillaceae bacterium]